MLICEVGPNGRLDFLYDESGQIYGFIKDNSAKYFYVKDILGTILGVVDENGELVARYEYTVYGECTVKENNSANIANINPFRFKCYYYDNESGMYYCQTRYLVPEWGRWLNADNPNYLQFDNINGMNLFAYCGNNPIIYSDPKGCIPKWLKWLIAGVATTALVVGAVALTIWSGGAFSTPLLAAGAKFIASTVSGAAVSATISLAEAIDSGNIDLKTFAIDTGIGALSGMVAYGTGEIFSTFGKATGLYLNEMVIGGLKVGDIFGSALPIIFNKAISFGGGILSGMLLDKKIGSMMNRQGSLQERFLNNLQGGMFSEFLEFIKSLW